MDSPVELFRIMIVEDHALVREGIVALLQQAADFLVCAETSSAAEALQAVRDTRPDLAVVDYFLGEAEDGTRLIRQLLDAQPSLAILCISLSRDDTLAERALRAGARGFLSKYEGTGQLLDAARIILAGGLFARPELRIRLMEKIPGARPAGSNAAAAAKGISDRELQVFQLLGTGLGISEIARRLGVSVKTVGAHREHLKDKLNCDNAEALALKAAKWVRSGGRL